MKTIYPRENRLSWNDHHMLLALITAQRSPDPNTQVGACIVNPDNRILGLGYNGLPKGIDDNKIDWARHADNIEDTKYPYVVHAEKNAIYNTNNINLLRGATLFTTLFPCNECAKDIIQAGIKVIFYLEDLYYGSWENNISKWLLTQSGIRIYKHEWNSNDNIDIKGIININTLKETT